MLRRYIYLFFVFLFALLFNTGLAQTRIDSLKKVYGSTSSFANQYQAAVLISKQYINTLTYDSALLYAREAVSLSEKHNYIAENIKALQLCGTILKEQGAFEESFNVLEKSLSISEKYHELNGASEAHLGLGMLLLRMRNYKKSEYYLQNALNLKLKLKDYKTAANIYTNLATAHVGQKLYKKAIDELLVSISILDTIRDDLSKAAVYGNLGRIYKEQGNLKQSIEYFNKALEIGEAVHSEPVMLRALTSLSGSYLGLYELQKQSNEGLAKRTLLKAETLITKHYQKAITLNDPNARCFAYKNLYALAELKENYKEALDFHKLYAQLCDSLLTAEANEKVTKLSLQKETELKDREIVLLNKEKDQKRKELEDKAKNEKILLISSLLVFMLLGISIFFVLRSYKHKQKISLEKVQKEKIQAELSMLKDQISPHVVFNILNIIYFEIESNRSSAQNLVLKFSDLLRYQLYECNKDFIEIEKEINYLGKFVEVQQARKFERCRIEFEVDPKVKDIMIAPLLFNPMVENAFKYVSNTEESDNFVTIGLYKTESGIKLLVKNSYFSNEKKLPGGIGLTNLKNRLKLIYPNKHKIELSKDEVVFNAELTLYI